MKAYHAPAGNRPFYLFVGSAADLPPAVNGVITLAANTTYLFTTTVDLLGARIVCGANTTLLGGSSENCGIISTGLVGTALITSAYSLPMRNLFITADVALALNGTGTPTAALDWMGVNFVDCNNIGTIANYSNFIMADSAFLNSGNLTFDGTFGTIGFSQSLFVPAAGQSAIIVPATATISRRFRIIYSSIVALGFQASSGLNVDAAAITPNESYILDNVNFSGGGTYLIGADDTSNKVLFTSCVGVENSGNVALYYMVGNAVATDCTVQGTFYKVAGATSAGPVVQKFTLADNRATYVGSLIGFFKVTATLSVSGPANAVVAVRVALGGVTGASSEVRGTTNAGGRSESMTAQYVASLSASSYLEVFIANTSSAGTSLTVSELNVVIERLN